MGVDFYNCSHCGRIEANCSEVIIYYLNDERTEILDEDELRLCHRCIVGVEIEYTDEDKKNMTPFQLDLLEDANIALFE